MCFSSSIDPHPYGLQMSPKLARPCQTSTCIKPLLGESFDKGKELTGGMSSTPLILGWMGTTRINIQVYAGI